MVEILDFTFLVKKEYNHPFMWKKIAVYAHVVTQYILHKMRSSLLHRNIHHVRKNQYDVHYRLHDKPFILRTRVRRGPCRLVSIRDRRGVEVSGVVRPYLGPGEDCHHDMSITPADIGFREGLYFFFRGGVGTFLRGNEKIQIDQMHGNCMRKKMKE